MNKREEKLREAISDLLYEYDVERGADEEWKKGGEILDPPYYSSLKFEN